MRVAVTLTNRDAWITEATKKADKILQTYWSYAHPFPFRHPGYRRYQQAKLYARIHHLPEDDLPGWNGRIPFYKGGSVSAGLFRATHRDITQKHQLSFDLSYDLPKPLAFTPGFNETDPKYLFQNECVDKMCKVLRKGGGIVLSATATGKTKMAAQFCSKLPCSVLFVVDQLDLLYQSATELARWLKEKVGTVGESKFEPGRVTVATIQTLHLHSEQDRFKEWLQSQEVVIVDELHEAMAKRNFKVLDIIQPLAIFGLTATLQLQKKDVRTRAYAFAGPVIFEFPVAEAMQQNVVSQGSILQLRFGATADEYAKDYQEHYKEEVWNNETKIAAAVRITRWLLDNDHYVIVLVDRVKHLKLVQYAFKTAGVDYRVAWGGIKKDLRAEARAEFEKGDIRLIIANKVFKKGINLKRLDAILDIAEFKNKNDCLQKFGRGVRLHHDKNQLYYIDFGTQGSERFSTAAKSRARAFRKANLNLTVKNIDWIPDALKTVKKWVAKRDQSVEQLSLGLEKQ